ncbi:MAG: pseudouridine synthase [Ignavibacteriaceae bacterium]|nr:pseudouridine synthase [Ignavibacteriaceae bacterium]
MTLIRINKYLSDCGVSSRRKAEEYILQGRVSINNNIILELSSKVDPLNDVVLLDGEKIFQKRLVYFLLNKPKGVVTTTDDEKGRMTVVDLIKSKDKIFPVGRLDYNTTGVLILTNDGEFSNFLTHPGNRIPREYEAKLDRPLTEEDKEKLCKGIYIEGIKGKFIKVVFPDKKSKKIINVTAVEGRNHFVKNMFGALGYTVQGLNRKSFAGITADMPVGAYRVLSQDEISGVIKTYGK